MSGCRSVEWLTGTTEATCETCGAGPCKLSFRYPLGAGKGDPLPGQVSNDAAARSISNPVRVFDGVVHGKRQIVYRGEQA